MRTGSEWLAIIISYPTSESGIIIVLLKTPTKYREFFQTLFVKTTDFQLVFNFEQTCTVTIFVEHGLIYHDGLANQSSRIALSDDSVFNYIIITGVGRNLTSSETSQENSRVSTR